MTTSYKRISESVEDLLAKSHYMVAKCQVDGNLTFDGYTKTTEETDNESRCRNLCLRLEKALIECTPEEIPGLLEMYELLHRIGYAKEPSQSFIATQRNRVYTAWRSGNLNIQESQVYPLLKRSINGRHFAQMMLKNWIKTLLKHNRFPNVTTHENYRRLSIVMREDIDKELKRKWYEANLVDDLTTLSTPLLKSYRSFVSSLFPSVLTWKDQQGIDAEILVELIDRRVQNSYMYKALGINKARVMNKK